LALAVKEAGLVEQVPAAPARHMEAALAAQSRLRQATRWEVENLVTALRPYGIRLVLMKGAAYEMAQAPPARSRLFNDIDVLVPRGELANAELALLMAGWTTVPMDAYDRRYYRQWMHELPPMRHRHRRSVVDIHHNLVPDTARIHPDPERLLAAAVTCPDRSDVWVLAPTDMVLHSAVHLFNDGEFDHGLRDLFDIRDLVRHFLTDERDWNHLVERAGELELGRPLFYALRYLSRDLGCEVPHTATAALQEWSPPRPVRPVLDRVFRQGLRPDHRSCRDPATAVARWFLFVRGHFLRMPLHLLIPHLVRKSFRGTVKDP
jgi:hypothetical protein